MNKRKAIRAAILDFGWHNFGLDDVEAAEPDYANHLADEILSAMHDAKIARKTKRSAGVQLEVVSRKVDHGIVEPFRIA